MNCVVSGWIILFHTFLESSTIIMVLSALVRLLVLRIALARRAVPDHAFQVTKTYPDETAVQVKFMKKKHNLLT